MGSSFFPAFFFACLILIALTSARDFGYSPEDLLSEDRTLSLYESWLAKHNRGYQLAEEKQERFEIFKNNLRYIDEVNQQNLSYWLGLNKFADMRHEEFKSTYLGYIPPASTRPRSRSELFRYGYEDLANLPESIDWREKGAVTGVKTQGQCGDCWAFTTVGAVEGINQIVTGQLVSLSEQELLDCSKPPNGGCNGGAMDYAYAYIVKHGIASEVDYPYQAKDGFCNKEQVRNRVVKIDGYVDVPQNDVNALLITLANQPLSVGIDASSRKFQLYKGGVLSGKCGTHQNHGLVAVGYGTELGKDYILAKNSWGIEYGEEGYVKIERLGGRGMCGINMMVAYPVLSSP